MADESIYLGLPGALQKIWWPTGGLDGSRIRDSSTFKTGSGGMRMSKLLNGARTYALDYAGLGRDNFALLEAYDQGHMGPGPFAFFDPGRRNLLSENQSGTTSVTNDTRDFTLTTDGNHTISSDTSQTLLAPPRALRWGFTQTPASAYLVLDPPSKAWPIGIPVMQRPYTYWCRVLGIGTSVNYNLDLYWYDKNGAQLSVINTASVASSLTDWQRPVLTGTPPAGAVWAKCAFNVTNATVQAGDALIIYHFMFQEGSAPDTKWVPGTGVHPVQVVSQRDVQPFAAPDFRKGNTLLLQEVR